jgi:hypothetical protein
VKRILRKLKDNYQSMEKEELWKTIRKLKKDISFAHEKNTTEEFANLLYELIIYYESDMDINSQLVLLRQLAEIAWASRREKSYSALIMRSIEEVKKNCPKFTVDQSRQFFQIIVDILQHYKGNKDLMKTASQSVIDLIRWGDDKEILAIKEQSKILTGKYPLNQAIKLLTTRVFMNSLFYLTDQNCSGILRIYEEYNCFALSSFELIGECENDIVQKQIFDEDINELLQEGIINAIINLTHTSHKTSDIQEKKSCYKGIRHILKDSEYLLRKKKTEEGILEDIGRLTYAFSQFNLWKEFQDIPLINDLWSEHKKKESTKTGHTKLLAIQKSMRIEEYDSLKSIRRGIVYNYNLENLEDIRKFAVDIVEHSKKDSKISLVNKVDAVIEDSKSLTDSLKNKGNIPQEAVPISEIQDKTSEEDNLMSPATKPEAISEQLKYLRELVTNEPTITNRILLTKGLIFSMGMYGLSCQQLNLRFDELVVQVKKICDKLMVEEIIQPLLRAIKLRALRFDGDGTHHLFILLHNHGIKFLKKSSFDEEFIDSLMRLLAYLSRIADIELLKRLLSQLEQATRLYLDNSHLNTKIAKALVEGVVAFRGSSYHDQENLLELLKNLANSHPYNQQIQLEYLNGLIYLIVNVAPRNLEEAEKYTEKALSFGKSFQMNEAIQSKIALILLISLLYMEIKRYSAKADESMKRLKILHHRFPQNSFIRKIIQIAEEEREKVVQKETFYQRF